jgi:hypothetical protein
MIVGVKMIISHCHSGRIKQSENKEIFIVGMLKLVDNYENGHFLSFFDNPNNSKIRINQCNY